jgi:hypothetical protein
MVDLVIKGNLAEAIRELAERQQRTPEDLLQDWVEARRAAVDPEPRPTTSLPDEWIDVPEDIVDQAAYRAGVRAMRPRLYQMAREYWRSVQDHERLKLTDEELDKVFWLIDHEGIPRFLHEKESIVLPPDPLEALVGLFADSPVQDASTTVRETMAAKYGRSD